jgi:hypothetical protein
MLTGAALESGQNPKSVGTGSYWAWQIQKHSGRNVTPQQAENPSFAAKFMVGAYSAAMSKVPSSLWNSNPSQAAEEVAYAAERPAVSYYNSQGAGHVTAAYNLAASEMGDPLSTFTPSSPSGRGTASSFGSARGGGGINIGSINMPIQVVSGSQQDAQNLARMVIREIEAQAAEKIVSMT